MSSSSRLLSFAPGAGAPTTSSWMVAWRARLERLGPVVPFDYPYQRAGKKGAGLPPCWCPRIARSSRGCGRSTPVPIILIGKSMGGRIGVPRRGRAKPGRRGCYGASDGARVSGLSAGCAGRGRTRPGVGQLDTPVLFVQGTRDSMCPLDRLADVRARMRAPSELFVVEGGDHSLIVQKALLKKHDLTQEDVDQRVFEAIEVFLSRWAPAASAPD